MNLPSEKRSSLIKKLKASIDSYQQTSSVKPRVVVRCSTVGGDKPRMHLADEHSEVTETTFKEISDQLKQLAEEIQAERLRDLYKLEHKHSSESYAKKILEAVKSINVYPQTSFEDYLSEINYSLSSSDALHRDWSKIGDDLWISLAKTSDDVSEGNSF